MFLWISIVAAYALYKWLTKNDDFFLKKGIPYEKPLPIVGNLLGFVLQKEAFVDAVQRSYEKHKKSKYDDFTLHLYRIYEILIKFLISSEYSDCSPSCELDT